MSERRLRNEDRSSRRRSSSRHRHRDDFSDPEPDDYQYEGADYATSRSGRFKYRNVSPSPPRRRHRSRSRSRSRSRDYERRRSRYDRSRSRSRSESRSRSRERWDNDGDRRSVRRGRAFQSAMDSVSRGAVRPRYARDGGGVGAPNQLVVIKRMHPDTDEHEIKETLIALGFSGTESVRVMRDQDGVSRRFATVKFPSIEEATRFVEAASGGFHLGHSVAKAVYYQARGPAVEWACRHCGKQNGLAAVECSQCRATRSVDLLPAGQSSKAVLDGQDDVSTDSTPLLLLRGLDAQTSADFIFKTFADLSAALRPGELDPTHVRLIHDKQTGSSLSFAFVEFPSSEVCRVVHEILNNKSYYPSGFFLHDRQVHVAYGKPTAFKMAYAPGKFTAVTPDARILVYRDDAAYPVGHPTPELVAPTAAAPTDDDDPLAAFYAEIGGEEPAAVAPPSDPFPAPPTPIPSADLDLPPFDPFPVVETEDYLDVPRRLCALCQRQFTTRAALRRHAAESPLHATNRDDPLAVQLALFIKYHYRHPKPKPKRAATLAEGIGGKLLAKMGWGGGGLGRTGDGIVKPIQATAYTPGAGIGAGMAVQGDVPLASMSLADRARETARMRYQ
ncbi:hypothetical protein GGF31_004519 [Allomyces arbusculus]|nr:hypothetical protein GGF31_004519 [Allomyces arbusculus]